ncbi:unnamed protein product [Rhodiola kirilowii]
MASPVAFAVDDKDLDDAALWAVIDSAVASHAANSKSRTPLAIKHAESPNFHTPPPPVRNYKSPRVSYSPRNEGEVVQVPYCRPQKMARSSCGSEMSETSPPSMAVVRHHVQRTPIASPVYASSPEIGRVSVKEFSGVSGMESASWKVNEEEVMRHSLSGMFPSVALFKEYQNAAMAILEKGDYTMISGNPFIKKTGWRKISFYFNLSYEIKDKNIEFDENRNVQRAEFVVRAHMQGGRFSDGWGSCERREKRFLKPNHDIPSTAETRAKSKACQDLLGIGEYRPGASHAYQQ